MEQALCIDFGTSSIRSVLRDTRGNVRVLPIGQITKRQEIDGASIPSAVCIDSNLNTIRFGQHAREAMLSGKSLGFAENSPKLWLKDPTRLHDRVVDGCALTRFDLLAGLLAYALFAAGETKFWKIPDSPDDVDLRVAHPVWPHQIRSEADAMLHRISWLAANMAAAGDWGQTTVDTLKSWTTANDGGVATPELKARVDTIEPVASAVELLTGQDNQRRACVVVDVGAGTTDIGVFYQVLPDARTNKPQRLVPAGPTVSVFEAGDAIDRAVLALIRTRYPQAYEDNRTDITTRIRALKEDLFRHGRLQIHGASLTVDELESEYEAQRIAGAVRRGLHQCLSEAVAGLKLWSEWAKGINSKPQVLMTGGGASIGFLHRAIGSPLKVNDLTFECEIKVPKPPKGLEMHGAGYARLTVGLGAVGGHYDKVIHEHQKVLSVPGLGSPKQRVS